MVTHEFKIKVVAALQVRRENFGGSDSKFAVSLGIAPAQYSRIMKGETDKVLSDGNWISLARQLGVNMRNEAEWNTARTPVYEFITAQLTACQQDSISSLLCDLADIGKTYTAQEYARNNRNAVYVDCSQVKSKQKLVRHIAQAFGVNHTGKYNNVYEDLVWYLKSIPTPLIILDEAGDLNYDAFLEIKALWNATERACGWCMMGADGLKEKVQRAIDNKKVGYTEVFSRFGSRYQRITQEGKGEAEKFAKLQAALIIKANAPEGTDVMALVNRTQGSLRRVNIELLKINRA